MALMPKGDSPRAKTAHVEGAAKSPHHDAVTAFVRMPAADKPLMISRCMSCGLIVAAASDRRILQLAEQLHHCPVYYNYMPQAS